jgi:hypothetical protein
MTTDVNVINTNVGHGHYVPNIDEMIFDVACELIVGNAKIDMPNAHHP